MFSRFLLGDLFIHGIGGAKYDELGNEIARRFFDFEPPGFLTLSLTLWLGLPAEPATAAELAAVQRRLRDLTFNPDRYLDEPDLEEVRILINGQARGHRQARHVARERIARGMAIRRYNEALQPWVETLRAELARRKARLLRVCGRIESPTTASLHSCCTPGIGTTDSRNVLRARFRIDGSMESVPFPRARNRVRSDRTGSDSVPWPRAQDRAGDPRLGAYARPGSGQLVSKKFPISPLAAAEPITTTYNENETTSRDSQRNPLDYGRGLPPCAAHSIYGGPEESLRAGISTCHPAAARSSIASGPKPTMKRSTRPCSMFSTVPDRESFLGALCDPAYRPDQRLLAKVDGKVVSHVHLTERHVRYGSVSIPINGVMWVGTLPEFRGMGFAQNLMRLASQRARENGFVLQALTTGMPQFYRPLGWGVCGRQTFAQTMSRNLPQVSDGVLETRGASGMFGPGVRSSSAT